MSYLKYFEDKEKGVVVVSMGPEDLFLEGVAEVARRAGIHTGVILCGLGGLKKACLTEGAETKVREGFFQLTNFTGLITGYAPHIHVTMLDIDTKQLTGGHLNEGSVVGSVVELSILRLDGLRLESTLRDGSSVKLLDAAKE